MLFFDSRLCPTHKHETLNKEIKNSNCSTLRMKVIHINIIKFIYNPLNKSKVCNVRQLYRMLVLLHLTKILFDCLTVTPRLRDFSPFIYEPIWIKLSMKAHNFHEMIYISPLLHLKKYLFLYIFFNLISLKLYIKTLLRHNFLTN